MKKVLILIILLVGAGLFVYVFRSRFHPDQVQTFSAVDQTVDVLTGVGAIKQKQDVADPQLAVIRAKAVFQKLQAEETDFSHGPCIAEDLMPDWVADVAHNPRQATDDLPQNQCQNFREGRAHHFVELDVNGEVIRMQ